MQQLKNRSYKNDNSFGLTEEDKILPILEKYFGEKITKSLNKYEKWDGEGLTSLYEIKSRTNKHNAFNDTIIAMNKVVQTSKAQFFIFNFTDGIYYIKYNETLFNSFTSSPFLCHKREDIIDTIKQYYYIPIKHLSLIELKQPAMTTADFFRAKTDVLPLKGRCLIKL